MLSPSKGLFYVLSPFTEPSEKVFGLGGWSYMHLRPTRNATVLPHMGSEVQHVWGTSFYPCLIDISGWKRRVRVRFHCLAKDKGFLVPIKHVLKKAGLVPLGMESGFSAKGASRLITSSVPSGHATVPVLFFEYLSYLPDMKSWKAAEKLWQAFTCQKQPDSWLHSWELFGMDGKFSHQLAG